MDYIALHYAKIDLYMYIQSLSLSIVIIIVGENIIMASLITS